MTTKTVKIVVDGCPSNPRTDMDNLTVMACLHGRYDLGDKNAKTIIAEKLGVSASDYSVPELVEMAINKKGLVFAHSPLYLYDHSGITMSTKPFSCPWDSGQVGEILIFTADIKEAFGVKRIGKKKKALLEEKAKLHIESDVKIYDNYISGEVYGFQILDEDGNVEDSCYGFYGDDVKTNGILDYIPEDLHEEAINAEISYS